MCIYDVLSLFLFLLFCFQYCARIKDIKVMYCGVFAILFVMCFKSVDTGGLSDLQDYVNLYMGKDSMYDSDEVEPGLGWLCRILNIFPKSTFAFISFTTLIIMIPIFWGIKQYSQNKMYSLMLLFVLPGIWLVVFIAMRQALAQSFILSSIFICMNRKRIRGWKIYSLVLIIISACFHSTPYIIVPLAICTYYLPEEKPYMYIALIGSLVLSSMFSQILANTFLGYFGNVSQIERITYYIKEETYGMDTGFNLLNFAPLTILTLVLVYYNDVSQDNAFFIKALVVGVILYNLLGNIPLVNRAICFFFVMGAVGAVPKIKSPMQFLIMAVLVIYFIWRNYVHYEESPSSAYLPYYFIWE